MKTGVRTIVIEDQRLLLRFALFDVQALSAKEVYAKTADQVVTIECWNSNYIRTKQEAELFSVVFPRNTEWMF